LQVLIVLKWLIENNKWYKNVQLNTTKVETLLENAIFVDDRTPESDAAVPSDEKDVQDVDPVTVSDQVGAPADPVRPHHQPCEKRSTDAISAMPVSEQVGAPADTVCPHDQPGQERLMDASSTVSSAVDDPYWIQDRLQVGGRMENLLVRDSGRLGIVTEGQMLNDEIIDGAQVILRSQYQQRVAGLCSIHLGIGGHCGFKCVNPHEQLPGTCTIQMLLVDRNHWVVACASAKGQLFVFDSLIHGAERSPDLLRQMAEVFHHFEQRIVIMAECQQQPDVISCGFLAIAFAVEFIAEGYTAALQANFDLRQIRRWLFSCFETRRFERCPQVVQRMERPDSSNCRMFLLVIPEPVPCVSDWLA
jgi:hypothetical protein